MNYADLYCPSAPSTNSCDLVNCSTSDQNRARTAVNRHCVQWSRPRSRRRSNDMNFPITTNLTRKADSRLRAALRRANPDDVLRVVMILQDQGPTTDPVVPNDPSGFLSRADYRHAVLTRRREALRHTLGPALKDLEHLNLKVSGGTLGHAVVADASARQILKSIELDSVTRVVLDRPVRLPKRPLRRGSKAKRLK
jgi:hypothetical protein